MGILLLWVPIRCDIVRTVIFDGVGLFGLILRVALVRRWFTLLYRWVYMTVVSAEAGFGAALTLPLWLLLEGTTLRCALPFLVIVFFGCVHHVYII